MLRRNIRLRKEFLYRKSLEGKEKDEYEKKRKIRKALQEGKELPPEVRGSESTLRKKMKYDDEGEKDIDDEYSKAGGVDPKIFITTSRDPSSRLLQFAKELKLIFPNSQRINRGNHVVEQLIEACRTNEVSDLVIIHEHRGEPDGLVISHLPYGPTAYFGLTNCVMRHDIRPEDSAPQEYPHLVFHNFSTKLGERVGKIIKYLFPVPKDDSKRVLSFVNQHDFISFRHHVYEKKGKDVELTEIGPRFEMRLYQIKLGTLEMDEADSEFNLKPFMRSAKSTDKL
eukprot:TRINITY_DN5365_c0_g1_i2.p1 TRINITY_DN5365_c0_g1~~TRINITY_DN5365_c0_g1_i2.p1  ORF type:complete len:298 (-),score=82.79 TRINITY_DN5365_c0_g1_i2:213-1061(-)